jgi:hypothetical protein
MEGNPHHPAPDPPLHEFPPHDSEELAGLAREMGRDPKGSSTSWTG